MQLNDREPCVTDLSFDRWFAREHDAAREAELDEHLRGCARCRLRGELLERERDAFLTRVPTFAAHTEHVRAVRRARSTALRAPRSWWPAFGTAAAAAVTLLAWVAVREPAAMPEIAQTERTKGGFSVGFYVKRGSSVQRGASGETVHPGDQVRFTYSSPAASYFALLGRDDHGVSVYFPASEQAAPLAAGRDQAFDFSLELDDQLGTERLFAVSCPAPFALAPLREALQAGTDLSAPAGCRVERIALHKRAAP